MSFGFVFTHLSNLVITSSFFSLLYPDYVLYHILKSQLHNLPLPW